MTDTRQIFAIWTHPAIIISVFLIVVNLACGFIAVEFRYPSLWGVSDVFKEYALPLHLSWAIAHWPSMLILCVLLFRMRDWDEAQITKIRCVLLAGIALCIAIEFIASPLCCSSSSICQPLMAYLYCFINVEDHLLPHFYYWLLH
ncbi:MAG: hypothetical protein ACI8PB_001190 [Desulforhopalus sp.]|jgi:hypothetical protein